MITENEFRNALKVVAAWREQNGMDNLGKIIKSVLVYYGHTKDDLDNGRRTPKSLLDCRKLICYLSLLYGESTKSSASLAGLSHHSTAIWHRARVQDRMSIDDSYKELVEYFERDLKELSC